MKQIINEALTFEDNNRIIDIEFEILQLKRDMLTAIDSEKERLKNRIEYLKQEISDIKERGKDK